MIKPYVPPELYENASSEVEEPLDYSSLISAPPQPVHIPAPHDFESLNRDAPLRPPVVVLRSQWADYFIDFFTPVFIFFACQSVLVYLLMIRYVYTDTHDSNLRFFLFFLLLGIVALNRLLAHASFQTKSGYALLLGYSVAAYVLATSMGFGVYFTGQSVAASEGQGSRFVQFFGPHLWPFILNSSLLIFVWWVVNRLTRECCLDEDAFAGDIGILTAAADRLTAILNRPEKEKTVSAKIAAPAGISEAWQDLRPRDPTETYVPLTPQSRYKTEELRPGSHPGMAIFYFSAPVLLLFILGPRYFQHLGEKGLEAGSFYVVFYLFCAFFLLALTALRQLRAFFSVRSVSMSEELMWFWLVTAFCIIVVILRAAALFPMPSLPPPAYVAFHEQDPYRQGAPLVTLLPVEVPAFQSWDQQTFRKYLDGALLVFLSLVLLYVAGKRILSALERHMLQQERSIPLFTGLLRLLMRFLAWLMGVSVAKLMQRGLRIQRHIAFSTAYGNPYRLGGNTDISVRDHTVYAYEALRALSTDIGSPVQDSMTPYEFLEHFPKRLDSLKEEASDVIRLYVIAQYSTLEMDARMEDRLRRFWQAFQIVRDANIR
ncbi:MAG: hypothetical protein BWY07_00906 [Candidatus Hydrogenedentes bacterium ADurb.Bin170]|nr:MAG: hypothetical protein BWY07_00906 [Candidatus Hydrogenedentes bacterium ADurb.Bin170]